MRDESWWASLRTLSFIMTILSSCSSMSALLPSMSLTYVQSLEKQNQNRNQFDFRADVKTLQIIQIQFTSEWRARPCRQFLRSATRQEKDLRFELRTYRELFENRNCQAV